MRCWRSGVFPVFVAKYCGCTARHAELQTTPDACEAFSMMARRTVDARAYPPFDPAGRPADVGWAKAQGPCPPDAARPTCHTPVAAMGRSYGRAPGTVPSPSGRRAPWARPRVALPHGRTPKNAAPPVGTAVGSLPHCRTQTTQNHRWARPLGPLPTLRRKPQAPPVGAVHDRDRPAPNSTANPVAAMGRSRGRTPGAAPLSSMREHLRHRALPAPPQRFPL